MTEIRHYHLTVVLADFQFASAGVIEVSQALSCFNLVYSHIYQIEDPNIDHGILLFYLMFRHPKAF